LTRLPEFRENTLNKLAANEHEISNLSTARDELLQKIEQYQAELTELRQGHEDSATHQEDLTSQMSQYRYEFDGLQRAMVASHEELGLMRTELLEGRNRFHDADARIARFETEQVPKMLEIITDMNHRLISDKRDVDNLVQSFPIALREIKRNLVTVESTVGDLSTKLEVDVGSLKTELATQIASAENLVQSFPIALREIKRDLVTVESTVGDLSTKLEVDVGSLETELATQIASAVDSLNAQRIQTDERLQQLLARNDTSSEEYDTLRQQLDALNQSASYLMNRVEFVRREVLFEMRYGAGSSENLDDVEPEIVAPDKLASARKNGLKVNLGCGHIALDGYINVDRRKLPGVDVVSDIDKLPLKKGEVSEVFSAHVLEHFPEEQLVRELLPYWVALLKKGGIFRAVVPDAQAMTENFVNGDYPYKEFREVIYGSQDYDGDFHYNMFTPESLTELLQDAGLKNVELVEAGRKNGACYELEIRAVK
jgi:predicted SAM-dependent methyltransferase/chromosome segregation ATPase